MATDYSYAPKRIMVLSAEIEENTISKIVQKIYKFNAEDRIEEEKNQDYAASPIHLLLNTYGGSVYDGLALIGAIESSVTPVHVTCLGKAMSMGLCILACGHVRFANRYSSLMYHQASDAVEGKLDKIRNDLKETERIDKLCDEILFRKSKLTPTIVKAKLKNKEEWYFSGKEALRYGIVDYLV